MQESADVAVSLPFRHRPARWLAAALVVMGLGLTGGAHAEIAESADQVSPLLVGAEVPRATVRTLDGEAVVLPELLRGEKSILIFYRGGW